MVWEISSTCTRTHLLFKSNLQNPIPFIEPNDAFPYPLSPLAINPNLLTKIVQLAIGLVQDECSPSNPRLQTTARRRLRRSPGLTRGFGTGVDFSLAYVTVIFWKMQDIWGMIRTWEICHSPDGMEYISLVSPCISRSIKYVAPDDECWGIRYGLRVIFSCDVYCSRPKFII